MATLKETELAWLAGIIDADAHYGIKEYNIIDKIALLNVRGKKQ